MTRYLHTLKHLRPDQLRAQLWNRVRRMVERPERWDPGTAPPVPPWAELDLGGLPAPVPVLDHGAVRRGELTFVNETRQLGWPFDWEPDASLLWRYNLHYHDWLWSLRGEAEAGWKAALEAVLDWIEKEPLQHGAVGWAPYPISLRLQNWVVLLFLTNRDRLAASGAMDRIWGSVWKQACWLEKHLEYHLRGNHLFENAATLALLGSVFSGPDGERWRRKGMTLLAEQLREQFLPDGMHFELSPMYHLRMTWLLEMLVAVGDDELKGLAGPVLTRNRGALSCLRHPDGRIALLNDSMHGVYPELAAGDASPGTWALENAGYFGYRGGNGDYIVCDAGPVGPDEQPGHAHADCLSFELSLGGARVITDTGVSDYEVSESRAYTRSTAAHNSVEIEGADQSEMWGAFRVARRAVPEIVRWEPREDGLLLEAGHNGYRRLAAGVTHRRRFEFAAGRLVIHDAVAGRGSFRAVARLHFAPGCTVDVGGEEVKVVWEGGSLRLRGAGDGEWKGRESPYYERFGVKRMRPMLEYTVEVQDRAEWEMTLEW